jgi:hypothetical protein
MKNELIFGCRLSSMQSKPTLIFVIPTLIKNWFFFPPVSTNVCESIFNTYSSNIVVVAFAALLNGKPDMTFTESQWKILAEILETIEKLRTAQYGGHTKEHNQSTTQQRSRKGTSKIASNRRDFEISH